MEISLWSTFNMIIEFIALMICINRASESLERGTISWCIIWSICIFILSLGLIGNVLIFVYTATIN